MSTKGLLENQITALWEKAQSTGVTRRKFLILLASGGATAVLAACTPKIAQTPSASPATTSSAPASTPSPSPRDATAGTPCGYAAPATPVAPAAACGATRSAPSPSL